MNASGALPGRPAGQGSARIVQQQGGAGISTTRSLRSFVMTSGPWRSGRVDAGGRAGRAARVDALDREGPEDLPDHPGLRDERDDAHRSATAQAHERVDLVDPPDEPRPTAARCSPLKAGRLVRDRRRSRRSTTADGRGRVPRAPSPHHARVAEDPGLETGEILANRAESARGSRS
jgi:hypothetical protein